MKRKMTEPTETSKFEISPSMGDAISRAAALAFNRDIDLKTTVKNVSLWARSRTIPIACMTMPRWRNWRRASGKTESSPPS